MSITTFFNTILYQPLLNLLLILYIFIPGRDFGVSVIVLTFIVKLILFPTSFKTIKSQRKMAEIQPKMKEIQEKYKDNKEAQSKATMELYQKEKVNPMSGCLPLLIQLPIFIALYQVFLNGLNMEVLSQNVYSFVHIPENISFTFLGFLDLTKPNVYLAILSGILQFFQIKLSTSTRTTKGNGKNDMASNMQKKMMYFMPVLSFFVVWRLGSIIGLYWVTSSLFSILEQYIIKKHGQTKDNK